MSSRKAFLDLPGVRLEPGDPRWTNGRGQRRQVTEGRCGQQKLGAEEESFLYTSSLPYMFLGRGEWVSHWTDDTYHSATP